MSHFTLTGILEQKNWVICRVLHFGRFTYFIIQSENCFTINPVLSTYTILTDTASQLNLIKIYSHVSFTITLLFSSTFDFYECHHENNFNVKVGLHLSCTLHWICWYFVNAISLIVLTLVAFSESALLLFKSIFSH